MITKDVTAELEAVLTQLTQEGKTPSVALVKARLSQAVPMPALIATIKNWKASKPVPKIEVAAETTVPLEQRVTQLEQQVDQLLLRIAQLEHQQNESLV
jgi:TolA-binding protein